MSTVFNAFEDSCKKTIEHFKKELGRMRTGRANGALLEGLMVDYYGSQVPLIQLGMINTPEPRLITVQVYDAGAVEAIEKAVMQADLGLTPNRDGSLIRMQIPALTEERRKDLIKKLHKTAEENRVVLRTHRRETLDVLKKQEKDKEISADDLRRGTEQVQKIVDKYIVDIDALLAAKEKEMMEV
jgi:ribosome recycling factor